jgi:RNA polymerase sigma-70 factor (ECF subfamily)
VDLAKEDMIFLVEKAKKGSRKALASLYEAFHSYIRTKARRVVYCDADAEDVLQEVFLRVINKIHLCSNPDSFPSFIGRIAFREACRLRFWRCFGWKSKGKGKPHQFSLSDIFESQLAAPKFLCVGEDLDRSEFRCQVLRLVNHLPEKYRSVLKLFYLEEKSINGIAINCRIPVGTAKRRLHMARIKLKNLAAVYFLGT